MTVLQSSIAAASGSAAPAGYQIERSLRLNSADSAYLSWIPPQSGNRRTWTWSGWIKKSMLSSTYGDRAVIFGGYGAMSNTEWIEFGFGNSGDTGGFDCIYSTTSGSSTGTTSLYRDTSSWYHVVIALDTTQATQANRLKIYINGVLTNFASASFGAIATQNVELGVNGAWAHAIGKSPYSAVARNVNGYFAEVNFIDGQQLDPTSFGEFNSATGVWSPLAYTGTYGKNGFYLPFNDNSTALNLGRNRETLTSDPYFPATTLLLNGNGTNGAQNNTFLDSSTNNFTITRNGNTTQGTFTPFSQTGWGVSNTITQYCQLNNSDFALSTGDFTVELWMYCTDDSSYSATNFCSAPSNPNFTFGFGSGSSGARQLYLEYGGGATTGIGSAMSNYLNRWVHIAVVRQSGTVTAYLNGVSLGSVSKSAAVGSTANLYLLRNSGDANQDFRGSISNFRFCKSAVYTSNFTPSTTPFTTTSQGATNCVLLTFQDNRFKDNSSTAATVTPTGTAIQAFSPFAPTAAYSAATVGGSGYFDGSGDYLTIPANAAFNFNTGDFSLETWVYMSSFSTFQEIFSQGGGNFQGIGIYTTTSGKVHLDLGNGSSWYASAETTNSLKLNSWNHVAVVRQSTTYTIYINGVSDATTTNATFPSNASASSSYIGIYGPLTIQPFIGYMSGFRLVKGSAVVPSGAPTAPPTAVTNTQLLLNFTNGGIIDATGKNDLETVGNAQISTTQSKWGGSSIYFDGTGDYGKLQSTASANYNLTFGSSDFTIEMWVYPQNTSTVCVLVGQSDNATVAGGSFLWRINGNADFYSGGTAYNCVSASPPANTWSHIAYVRNGTSLKTYLNGIQSGSATLPSSTTAMNVGSTNYPPVLGAYSDGSGAFTGYMDDVRISKYARYTGNFTPPAAQFAFNQADINVKQWVPNNFSITAGVGNDSLVDSPTNYGTDTGAGGTVRGNYATFNPLIPSSGTPVNGNLDVGTNSTNPTASTFFPSTGKWYCEVLWNSGSFMRAGVTNTAGLVQAFGGVANSWCFLNDGRIYNNAAATSYGVSVAVGDTFMMALDLDAGKIWYGKNGTWMASGSPSTGANPSQTFTANQSMSFGVSEGGGTSSFSINFGQRPFAYTAPSGFKALCSTNLPTPAIGASSTTLANKQFDALTWTGDGTSPRTFSSLSFAPDLVWAKSRSGATGHAIYDTIRGAGPNSELNSAATGAEGAENEDLYGYLSAFTSNGFTATNGSSSPNYYFNQTSTTYVAWSWNAGNNSVSNTSGTITSTVRANPTAGISVVTYTGNGTGGATVGHGLGKAPSMIICKSRTAATNNDWTTYHSSIGNVGAVFLNLTNATNTTTLVFWNNTSPTSSVFSIGTNATVNQSSINYVAYAFAEVAGFSKFGSYTGNGSADGAFVYCGFRPRYVMIKRTDAAGTNWYVLDTTRNTYNAANSLLRPNLSDAEVSATPIDFLSNGFKLRDTDSGYNASGGTYIFAAFAEAPFNYARAR